MKKTTRPPKFDYLGKAFITEVESMAAKGYTDKDIAYGLVVKFGEILTPQYFKDLKNGTDDNGSPTRVSVEISAALARGRAAINLAVRSTYLKLALGGIKTKSTTKKKMVDEDGHIIESDLIQETEAELPPNLQALSVWLFNHDDDWRTGIIAHKREEAEVGGNDLPTEVNVRITYNQKSDLDLQTKFEEPSQ